MLNFYSAVVIYNYKIKQYDTHNRNIAKEIQQIQ